MTYTYRLRPGCSGLDHLAPEIICRAERHVGHPPLSRRQADAGIRAAEREMRKLMGPRWWPVIEIVRAE